MKKENKDRDYFCRHIIIFFSLFLLIFFAVIIIFSSIVCLSACLSVRLSWRAILVVLITKTYPAYYFKSGFKLKSGSMGIYRLDGVVEFHFPQENFHIFNPQESDSKVLIFLAASQLIGCVRELEYLRLHQQLETSKGVVPC